ASCGTLTCSDARFKTNVRPLRDGLETVAQLRPVHFDWRREEFPERNFAPGEQIGFIAQDVARVLPEVVQQDTEGYKAVDYARLTPVLVQALHELRAEKDAQIAALRAEVAELRALMKQREYAGAAGTHP